MKRILLFVAIESELPASVLPEGVELHYTGVGKVNAGIIAGSVLKGIDPEHSLVMNYGSAGSVHYAKNTLVRCTRFEQGDMDARPLAEKGITPFDELVYPHIESGTLSFAEEGAICITQDIFNESPQSVADMEAYAIAKACKIFGHRFVAYKFISDDGGAEEWQQNHNRGVALFLQELKKLL